MSDHAGRTERVIPFADYLGLEIKELHADGATIAAKIGDHLFQGSGRVHGGFYCILVEMAASAAATEWLRTEGAAKYYPTTSPELLVPFGISNLTDFLRPVDSGILQGVSTPVHRGRRTQNWNVEIKQVESGVVVAVGSLRMLNTVHE